MGKCLLLLFLSITNENFLEMNSKIKKYTKDPQPHLSFYYQTYIERIAYFPMLLSTCTPDNPEEGKVTICNPQFFRRTPYGKKL